MERVMSLLLNEFASYAKSELHLVLIGKERILAYDLLEKIQIHKPKWEFDNQKRNYHTIKTIFFIRRTISRINPDTVLSFGEMWNNLVLLALLGKKYPVYISDRSTPNKNLGKFQNNLRDILYPKAAGYIAQTEKAASAASVKKWNKNIKVIGNPVPTIKLNRTYGKNILTVGRLIKTKNIDRLINIFSQVVNISEEAKNWKLKIVGGNATGLKIFEELKNQISLSNLNHLIDLEGERNNVLDYLADAEIFAFTSTSEGFPNALAEAMSAGLAVVSYDCMAGPSDLIDNGINGFLVPEHDEQQYKERLVSLIENAELRRKLGQEAQIKMRKFSQTIIAKEFFDFISEKTKT
jgi:GalNAc-alpha-(1->4)-GalNAc-alpha-(1->3)-diNAcBac-PP-undecaprenol alpha-1,4-N-acetyl-D-galactosaminyltransferase